MKLRDGDATILQAMNKRTDIPSFDLEPGLLKTFKAFAAIRLLFTILSHGFRLGIGASDAFMVSILLVLGETIFLLTYLFSNRAAAMLGRFYLPIGLAFLTSFPVLEMLVRNQGIILRGGAGEAQAPVMTLLVVVILIAWQYSLSAMLAYCVLSGALLFFLSLPLLQSGQMPASIAFYTAFSTVVFLAIVGFVVNRLVATQRQQRAELKDQAQIREQLAAAQERNRLAGELHDVLAHSFSALTVELEAVRSLWFQNQNRAYEMLNSALKTANSGLDEARRAVRAIRAQPLETFGLAAAIHRLAVDASKRGNLIHSRNIYGDFSDLPEDIEQCVYRVAQEAISNVLQHANAKKLGVALQRQDGFVVLEITDDGAGFETAPALANGFGLQGMIDRAKQLGGTCEILSSPSDGTTVRLRLPERVK
ncbi:MAG: sensor histidine kinase [Chloroflexi bacterium]|nr:sensor histidine kinase [Chloroflexota bacterium]